MTGKKISVSASVGTETLSKIAEYAIVNDFTRSKAMDSLIKIGYLHWKAVTKE